MNDVLAPLARLAKVYNRAVMWTAGLETFGRAVSAGSKTRAEQGRTASEARTITSEEGKIVCDERRIESEGRKIVREEKRMKAK